MDIPFPTHEVLDPSMQSQTGFTSPAEGDEGEGLQPIHSMDGNMNILRFPDGSVAMHEDEEENQRQIDLENHGQNLAEWLPENVLKEIGQDLKQAIEEDIESQEEYFEAIAKVIELLGLQLNTEADKEDLPFKGAATVYSMALFESALDLVATAIGSLMPSTGMVDTIIHGNTNDQLRDEAYRKKAFFNYFLTQKAKEFKKEFKRTLLWAILTGSCYKKVYIDPALNRPTSMFIRPDEFIINREYSTHLTSARKTHILNMNERDIKLREMSGEFVSAKLMPQDSSRDDSNEIQDRLDAISGVRYDGQESSDDIFRVYECHVEYKIDEDEESPTPGMSVPYIISIDEKSGAVLRIVRNWKREDPYAKKQEYFVNYSCIPSLDGEGYGLIQYAGRQAEAATNLTRQLMNAGIYANFPGGVYMAGLRLENNNLRPAPGEFVPLQTGGVPINNAIQALPYKEPSASLKELLTMFEDNIRKPSAIVNQKVADMTPRAPMGSVLAMLESLQKVPNIILQSFHESFHEELMLWNDRFAEWLPEGKPYPFNVPDGEHAIMKTDFSDNVLVVPASDPSLQNSSYRFMQSEIILNQAHQSPDIHNMRYAYEYFYKNMGLSPDDIQQLLPAPTDSAPQPLNAITENQNLMTSKPVVAGIMQDHHAHKIVHLLVVNDPNTTPEQKAAANAHIQEHESFAFLIDMQQKIGFEMPEDVTQIPPEVQNQISIAAAQVAEQKLQEMKEQAGEAEKPIDPGVVGMAEVQAQIEIQNQRTETERMRIEFERMKFETDSQLEAQKILDKQQESRLKAELDNKKIELEALYKEKDLLLKELHNIKQQSPQTEIPLQNLTDNY